MRNLQQKYQSKEINDTDIKVVVNKMKAEISTIKVKHKNILQKMLDEMKQIQSLIKETLFALIELEKSSKVAPIIEYSSNIREFSKLPPGVQVSMP